MEHWSTVWGTHNDGIGNGKVESSEGGTLNQENCDQTLLKIPLPLQHRNVNKEIVEGGIGKGMDGRADIFQQISVIGS